MMVPIFCFAGVKLVCILRKYVINNVVHNTYILIYYIPVLYIHSIIIKREGESRYWYGYAYYAYFLSTRERQMEGPPPDEGTFLW